MDMAFYVFFSIGNIRVKVKNVQEIERLISSIPHSILNKRKFSSKGVLFCFSPQLFNSIGFEMVTLFPTLAAFLISRFSNF